MPPAKRKNQNSRSNKPSRRTGVPGPSGRPGRSQTPSGRDRHPDSGSKSVGPAATQDERTPLIDAPLSPGKEIDADPACSVPYHEQQVVSEEKNRAKPLVQSSSSSSNMSTYGTTTETVIEKTLQRLNSISQICEDPIESAPGHICTKEPSVSAIKELQGVRGNKRTESQFERQQLFSSLTMSNEFQFITSQDMKMNFNKVMDRQHQQHQQQKQKLANQVAVAVVLDGASQAYHQQPIGEASVIGGKIRELPSSNDVHPQVRQQQQEARNLDGPHRGCGCCWMIPVLGKFLASRYTRSIVLGAIVLISFLLTTIGNRHYEPLDSGRFWCAMLLALMYLLLVLEVAHRTLLAMVVAAFATALYSCVKQVPRLQELVMWVNMETVALMLGMMIVVTILSDTGLFNCVAIWSYKRTGGRFWILLTIMYTITGLLSALCDNVAAMLLMAPLLVRISDLQQMDPKLVLMIMIVASNMGGLSTPIGDAASITIGADGIMRQQGIDFVSFVYICSPASIIMLGLGLIYIRLRYRNVNNFKYSKPLAVIELEHEIDIWMKIRNQVPSITRDHATVLINVDNQINQLRTFLNKRLYYEDPVGPEGVIQAPFHANFRHEPTGQHRAQSIGQAEGQHHNVAFETTIKELEAKYAQIDSGALVAPWLVLITIMVLLFLQQFPFFHLNSLAWIALFAALTLLAFQSSSSGRQGHNSDDRHRLEALWQKIDWSTLVFISALFIVMEVTSRLGLIPYLGEIIMASIDWLPSGNWRSLGAITVMLWSSALVSATMNKIPFTAMMVKTMAHTLLEQQQKQEGMASLSPLPERAIIFAMVFGACLGSNGTLIGAPSNLVMAGQAERLGHPIGFNEFFKFSLPLTILSLIVANAYLIIVFHYFI